MKTDWRQKLLNPLLQYKKSLYGWLMILSMGIELVRYLAKMLEEGVISLKIGDIKKQGRFLFPFL
jgi:hypothetical protein